MGGHVLYLDGLHQANDSGPMIFTHRQIGLLPVALHPRPRRALVIGLGGGVTAGAVSLADGLTLDIVELSDSVVRGAAFFRHVNENVVRRQNVRVRVDDGRNYLLTTRERYDIVTADIIQPVHAGAGSLYSREYFALARRVLAPGGVMLQWIGARPVSQYHLIARTFLDVFPHATAWMGGSLFAGTVHPLVLDPGAYAAKLEAPGTRRALSLVGLDSFEALLAHYSAGPERLRAFLGPVRCSPTTGRSSSTTGRYRGTSRRWTRASSATPTCGAGFEPRRRVARRPSPDPRRRHPAPRAGRRKGGPVRGGMTPT